MENSIDAVNKVLFDTLEKLQTNGIKIETAKAIIDTSSAIAKNTSLQLQAHKLTKGQIAAPTVLAKGKTVFATLASGDTHAQKTEFAQSLGYKDVVDAIGDLSSHVFNKKFDEAFDKV